MYYLGIQWTQRTYSGHSGHTVDTSQQFSISVLTKNLSTYKISGSLTELVNIQYCDAREGECSLVGNCLFVCLFVWPVWLSYDYHYPTHGTIFGKLLFDMKCIF